MSSSSEGSMHEIHCSLGAAPKHLPPGPRAAPQLHPLRSVRRPGKTGAPRRCLSAPPLLRSDKSQGLGFVLLDDEAAVQGTTRIGVVARWSSEVVTLPRTIRATAPLPLLPVTITPASYRFAR